MTIRRARDEDAEDIVEIYNDAVLHSVATFDTEPRTAAEERTRLRNRDERHAVLVAAEGDRVLGWASLSRWSERPAYAATVEISLYVRRGFRGQGIGKRLSRAVLEQGRESGLHAVVARIARGGTAGVHILEQLGFERIGVMREVGRKFGKWLDVILMQKLL